MISRIQFGDARSSEAHGEEPVHLVVTSPPYWTIKDYNATSQIGHGDGYEAYLEARVENSKAELLSRLASEGISPAFRAALANLEKYSKLRLPASKKRKLSTSCAQPTESADIDGTWQMISPPEYPSCLGTNAAGERLFTLGRMSFDMYQPSDVVCSIQHQFNTVKAVEAKDLPRYVPKSLRREVDQERDGCLGRLKTYK